MRTVRARGASLKANRAADRHQHRGRQVLTARCVRRIRGQPASRTPAGEHRQGKGCRRLQRPPAIDRWHQGCAQKAQGMRPVDIARRRAQASNPAGRRVHRGAVAYFFRSGFLAEWPTGTPPRASRRCGLAVGRLPWSGEDQPGGAAGARGSLILPAAMASRFVRSPRIAAPVVVISSPALANPNRGERAGEWRIGR